MSASYRNLREYMEVLDAAGMLRHVTVPINKDTELHPLVRLQFRGLPEAERRAFLFENVVDVKGRKYDMPVLLCAMAGSASIYALGMRCSIAEIPGKWEHALHNPLTPNIVEQAAVQETVIEGEELKTNGLGRLPVPISTPGFDNAPYTSASHWISREPDGGLHNVGNYRGMIKSETRIGVLPGTEGHGMKRHVQMWREAGHDRMPCAVVIGVPPHIAYTAVTRVPIDVCEYDVAGGLIGKPVDLVRCRTVDILVPAEAEIVIEGTVPTRELEIEGAFGETPGYMARPDFSNFLDVTCITMRRNPIYLAFISQLAPSESTKIRQIGRASAAKDYMHANGYENVEEIFFPEPAASGQFAVVKLKKRTPDDGINALRFLSQKYMGKITIAVDDDIDIRDMDSVVWSLAFRVQPRRDVEIVDAPIYQLDPSLIPPGKARDHADPNAPKPKASALLIDATRKWDYAPISLPRRQYMERAMEIWQQLQLPPLTLKAPWFGYELGDWSDEEREEADLAVQGRHFETGAKQAAHRRILGDGENK